LYQRFLAAFIFIFSAIIFIISSQRYLQPQLAASWRPSAAGWRQRYLGVSAAISSPASVAGAIWRLSAAASAGYQRLSAKISSFSHGGWLAAAAASSSAYQWRNSAGQLAILASGCGVMSRGRIGGLSKRGTVSSVSMRASAASVIIGDIWLAGPNPAYRRHRLFGESCRSTGYVGGIVFIVKKAVHQSAGPLPVSSAISQLAYPGGYPAIPGYLKASAIGSSGFPGPASAGETNLIVFILVARPIPAALASYFINLARRSAGGAGLSQLAGNGGSWRIRPARQSAADGWHRYQSAGGIGLVSASIGRRLAGWLAIGNVIFNGHVAADRLAIAIFPAPAISWHRRWPINVISWLAAIVFGGLGINVGHLRLANRD